MRRKNLPFRGASETFYQKQCHLSEQSNDDINCGAYVNVSANADTADIHSPKKMMKDVNKADDKVEADNSTKKTFNNVWKKELHDRYR